MRFQADFQPMGQDEPTMYGGNFTRSGNIEWDSPEKEIPNYVLDKVGQFVELRSSNIQKDEIGVRIALAVCIGIKLGA